MKITQHHSPWRTNDQAESKRFFLALHLLANVACHTATWLRILTSLTSSTLNNFPPNTGGLYLSSHKGSHLAARAPGKEKHYIQRWGGLAMSNPQTIPSSPDRKQELSM